MATTATTMRSLRGTFQRSLCRRPKKSWTVFTGSIDQERLSTRAHAFSSASSAESSSSLPIFPLSTTDLGLEGGMIQPHLVNIRQLPEIESALQDPVKSIELLRRAVDIFSTMQGPEHAAVLAWIASSQQRTGDYRGAVKTLDQIQALSSVKDNPLTMTDLALAKAKALWLAGDFSDAKAICDGLLEDNANPVMERSPLHYASARTGQAITRLCLAESLDDVFSMKDPFNMTVQFLKDYPALTAGRTVAQLNLGAAEAVYAQIVGEARPEAEVPLDGAMRAWKQGMTMQQRAKTPNGEQSRVVAEMLQARLQSNLAWGLLRMPRERDHVKRASEFAGKALEVNDKLPPGTAKEGLTRTLTLVASCYHEAELAVTAEGLLHSAMDGPAVSPLEQLDLREAYFANAKLYSAWDRREGDAERKKQQATDMDSQLPGPWQGKSGIHSTLWFWTPSIFAN
jgi:tetratricopeptide (TPR) repeat protein